jgi:hypothetical protein
MDQKPLGVYDTTGVADILLKSSCTGTWGVRNTRQLERQQKTQGRANVDGRPSQLTVSAMICICEIYLLPRNASIGELGLTLRNTRIAMHAPSR